MDPTLDNKVYRWPSWAQMQIVYLRVLMAANSQVHPADFYGRFLKIAEDRV